MLGGSLEATQIIVQKPHVHLTQNVDTGTWNWYRLVRRGNRRSRTTISPSARPRLPEILLRNARIDFSEIRTGHFHALAFMAVDGQLAPSPNGDRYNFELQSRGVSEMGPSVSGWVSLGRGQVSAKLLNFSFGHDVRSMLPDEVPPLVGAPRPVRPHRHPRPVLHPRARDRAGELPSRDCHRGRRCHERARRGMDGGGGSPPPRPHARGGGDDAAGLYLAGGANVHSPPLGLGREALPEGAEKRESARRERVPPTIDRVAEMFEPEPLKLENVAGRFVFTQDGISIENVSGRVDNNGLRISGQIEGYNDRAGLAQGDELRHREHHHPVFAALHQLAAAAGAGVLRAVAPGRHLPADRRGQPPLARTARKSAGSSTSSTAAFFTVSSPTRWRGDRPDRIRRDPEGGADRVAIRQIRGRGIENGPNRNAIITLDGDIGPLGPNTGVSVTVGANDVSSEETLRQAFPPEVRRALVDL